MKKHVLVTGAAHGIGLETTRTLLDAGYIVWAMDNDVNNLVSATQQISSENCHWIEGDITRSFLYTDYFQQMPKDIGWLGLVNNAARFDHVPLSEYPLELWDKILATNLTAPFKLSQYFYGQLRVPKGCIVNIASTRAQMSEPNTFAYSASKGGLISLTHALAMSMGPGIRVNAISPGWIHIPGNTIPAPTEADRAWHAAGRVGKPTDIAHMVEYLLSDKSEFITGQNFVIDGGVTKKMVYPE